MKRVSSKVMQKVKITGQVFDESGEGIPERMLLFKSNPTSGTVTDLDGKFILMASPQKGCAGSQLYWI